MGIKIIIYGKEIRKNTLVLNSDNVKVVFGYDDYELINITDAIDPNFQINMHSNYHTTINFRFKTGEEFNNIKVEFKSL